MTHEQIFKNDDVEVLFDPTDQELPIRITGDHDWLTPDEAERLARAILAKVTGTEPVAAGDITFNEGVIRLAATHNKAVSFRYAKGDGSNIEVRTLVPSELKEVKGKTLVIGFDPDRDEPRAYRLDRVKGDVTVA